MYVDGMVAVLAYNDVVQWLYELIESKVCICPSVCVFVCICMCLCVLACL